MNLKLNQHRGIKGAILFWLLVFIILVVVAFVIVSIVRISKKVDTFKPKWDDVQAIVEAELAPYKEQYPNDTVEAFEVELLDPAVSYLITRTTNWVNWDVILRTDNEEEFRNWVMPQPDRSISSMFYHRQMIVVSPSSSNTNQ